MGEHTSYYLYQKYEQRGEQEPIPCYPNTYSVDGEGTMPVVVKMENDPACGGDGSISRWVNNGFRCDDESKYEDLLKQISYDSGVTWINTSETMKGELIDKKSIECGYRPSLPSWLDGIDYKIFGASYDYQLMFYKPCCGDDTLTLADIECLNLSTCDDCGRMTVGRYSQPTSSKWVETYTRYLYIGNCVTQIDFSSMSSFGDLGDVIIPNSVVSVKNLRGNGDSSSGSTLVLGTNVQEVTSLVGWSNIIIDAINPPTLGGDTLSTFTNIYVPISSVNLYKEDVNWGQYANRIKGL